MGKHAETRIVLKLLRLSLMLTGVLLLGTFGYRYVEGWGWLDALYMTAITMTTVGFGEVRQLDDIGRLLTIVLMLSSVGLYGYALTQLASFVVEIQLGSLLWKRRMEKRIEALHGHYLVCGYGRTGRSVCNYLEMANHAFVVLEQQTEKLEELQESGRLHVHGDATQDECLLRAGIGRATGLVAALGNDAENVYLVLSARQLNPALTIASWATNVEAERKVLRAGANHTFSPYIQGGQRIVHMLTTPHALEFLDHAMGGTRDIRLGEIEVQPGSALAGHSLQEAGIRRDLGVIVIGIRRADGTMQFNPAANVTLHEHDILIGIGSQEDLEQLRGMV